MSTAKTHWVGIAVHEEWLLIVPLSHWESGALCCNLLYTLGRAQTHTWALIQSTLSTRSQVKTERES